MPDRLPSLIVLAGFWVPPMVAGFVAAGSFQRRARSSRMGAPYSALAAFTIGYTAAWFLFNLGAMPPYIPGATRDPTFATPRAVAWLAVVAIGVIMPGSALACVLAFQRRRRLLEQDGR